MPLCEFFPVFTVMSQQCMWYDTSIQVLPCFTVLSQQCVWCDTSIQVIHCIITAVCDVMPQCKFFPVSVLSLSLGQFVWYDASTPVLPCPLFIVTALCAVWCFSIEFFTVMCAVCYSSVRVRVAIVLHPADGSQGSQSCQVHPVSAADATLCFFTDLLWAIRSQMCV